jgi:RNA polymerase sigma factor (sigma-70 family)
MAMVDADSVRSMYDDHAAILFAYFARRVGRELAEDLLAETFRAAIESHPTFDSARGNEKAWLFGIATNLLRRHWRTERRRLLALERSASIRAEHIDPLLGMADGVANRIDAETDAARLLKAVVDLPADDRDLLFLSGWERLNSTEIGQALEIAPATVRSRLHRIRADLRKTIDTPLTHPNRPRGAAPWMY